MTSHNFTEQDLQKFADFRKFINDHANFNLTCAQALTLVQSFQFLHELNDKIKHNILELKRLKNPPPKDSATE